MQEIEKKIVRRLVRDLLSKGYTLSVSLDRGFDIDEMVAIGSTDKQLIISEIFSGDECHLFVHENDDQEPTLNGQINSIGWVYLVIGNGNCIISDYTTNLDDVLKSTNELAEKLVS